MRTHILATGIALCSALGFGLALAADPATPVQPEPQTAMAASSFDKDAMHTVVHQAGPQQPGYGWQYFSASPKARAVVISPDGDYYYSRGKGLRWVAAAQPPRSQ